MQALCALPPLLAQAVNDSGQQVGELRQIIADLDQTVARTFFSLLDCHQHEKPPGDLVAYWHRENLAIALTAAQILATANLAALDELQQAIELDS